MLRQIYGHLRETGPRTLDDIARHFDVEPDAVEGILEALRRRGEVERADPSVACGGCYGGCSNDCGRKHLLIYSIAAEPGSSDR